LWLTISKFVQLRINILNVVEFQKGILIICRVYKTSVPKTRNLTQLELNFLPTFQVFKLFFKIIMFSVSSLTFFFRNLKPSLKINDSLEAELIHFWNDYFIDFISSAYFLVKNLTKLSAIFLIVMKRVHTWILFDFYRLIVSF
jgi:hypothetical protein